MDNKIFGLCLLCPELSEYSSVEFIQTLCMFSKMNESLKGMLTVLGLSHLGTTQWSWSPDSILCSI